MTFTREWFIHRYDSLGSTMDRAALLARNGVSERTAIVCAEQTAGRGRGGRSWQSPRGPSLYATLVLQPQVSPERLASLSLIIGTAVAEAIEDATGSQPNLKWPNDVWLGNDPERRKVAGILLKSSVSGQNVDYVLAGIGINIGPFATDLPAGATSLHQATGVRTTPDSVLQLLLKHIDEGYHTYLAANGRPSLAAWSARAALLGELVTVDDGVSQLGGIFVGIDEDGALLLEDHPGHLSRVVAGDMVRGPRRLD